MSLQRSPSRSNNCCSRPVHLDGATGHEDSMTERDLERDEKRQLEPTCRHSKKAVYARFCKLGIADNEFFRRLSSRYLE